MNRKETRAAGVEQGREAALNCEVGESDKAEAACPCNPQDAAEVCAECLAVAANEAEANGRQYAGHIIYDINVQPEDKAEGLYDAYEDGVGRGINAGIRARMREYRSNLAGARAVLAECANKLGLGGVKLLAELAQKQVEGEVVAGDAGDLVRWAVVRAGTARSREVVGAVNSGLGETALRDAVRAELGPDFLDSAEGESWPGAGEGFVVALNVHGAADAAEAAQWAEEAVAGRARSFEVYDKRTGTLAVVAPDGRVTRRERRARSGQDD